MCTPEVKATLFRSYCSSFYTAQLWTNYSRNAINKLYIAYHNTMKLFIGVSKREHTRPICVTLNIRYCPALIRNLIYKFMNRLLFSNNILIKALCESSCFYRSTMWRHWRSLLYTNGVGQVFQTYYYYFHILIYTLTMDLNLCNFKKQLFKYNYHLL